MEGNGGGFMTNKGEPKQEISKQEIYDNRNQNRLPELDTQMDFINASDAVLCMARLPYGILAIHRTASDAFMISICVSS
ncbi:hypothetical protein SK128_024712 [Halocaridina rubra]|uniref:Uncharacterized protein n=1 Tax=Halocaridina rubra TaxID=373956 RepID=A0AAN8ZNF0_HALRR